MTIITINKEQFLTFLSNNLGCIITAENGWFKGKSQHIQYNYALNDGEKEILSFIAHRLLVDVLSSRKTETVGCDINLRYNDTFPRIVSGDVGIPILSR